ncbi:MAG: preprotein translocase subunit SecE [Alphaproteobacteria bacterium]|jgi:preprotein translocase subunit SecE|nr:preprotein translocase subunit SecE [Alphaproteobacteria bacterium]|tara:strand:+ start:304 stop:516 length:213 start_codon:yes stop_codon:yes gene_type:complete
MDKAEKAKVNPSQFVREVRQEASKVTWASRKETLVATVMVFIFVFMAAVFFFFVDRLMSFGVRLLLGLGS